MMDSYTYSSRTIAFWATMLFAIVFMISMNITPAQASSSFFAKTWDADATFNIGHRHAGFRNSSFNSSVQSADNPWDNTSGAWFDFNWGGYDQSVTTWGGCTTVPSGEIWVGTGAISPLGLESTCATSTTIVTSTITVDRTGRTWHMSSSTSVPSGSHDLRSLLVHEFGHAAGFAHITSGCSGTSRPTMCSTLPKGTSYMRTLQSADKTEFAAAY